MQRAKRRRVEKEVKNAKDKAFVKGKGSLDLESDKSQEQVEKEQNSQTSESNDSGQEEKDSDSKQEEIGKEVSSIQYGDQSKEKEDNSESEDFQEESDYDSEEILALKSCIETNFAFPKIVGLSTTADFSEAMNKILSSQVKVADKQLPILSRSKGIEKRIDEKRLEYRARKVLNIENKKLASKDRVKGNFTTPDQERKLRKIGTRGVVTLFNAIREAQKAAEEVVEAVGGQNKLTTRQAKDRELSNYFLS
ncbi:hypothetical protein G9A89_000131 [Geosiphon pyriformis]|nr:hypothetical protein G9A89_000131 [Geosiphon pyriformis]